MSETLIAIRDLKDISFFINKYQRGYRWGMREIYSLLDDIYAFDITKDGFYCLQPLVVMQRTEKSYELIDGQQRCTTIFLILKYLLGKDYFQIRYETRATEEHGENTFLSQLQNFNYPEDIHQDDIDFDSYIWKYWKETFFLDNKIDDSVDNFYFFKAYCIILKWFDNDDKRKTLQHNLLENTRVIWYLESAGEKDVANIFINFNDGKISLDQAELIKGLFVLNFNKISDATRKSYEENQFADEWNTIEHHLKKPEFWNFIQRNKSNKDLANKITLLLELDKGKGNKEEDLFFTFRAYERDFHMEEKPEWRNLSSLYNLLDEWFNNRETYHLMGAVVHLTGETIHNVLLTYNQSHKKEALNNYLRSVLRKEFYKEDKEELKDKYDINEIKYGKSGVFPILLLYNIATAHIQDKKYLFPFDLFNNVRAWNIEHIYAKNSMGFETIEDLKEWKEELEYIIKDDSELSSNTELNYLINKISFDDLDLSNVLVKKIEPLLGDILNKDHFSNLCLLDDKTNIQVGKKIFRKKREMILEIEDRLDKKAYVPLATKQVFQKSLTPSEEIRMNYWNTIDRDFYLSDIKNKINQFLEKQI